MSKDECRVRSIELELPARITQLLEKNGILYIDDFEKYTQDSLLKIEGLGMTTLMRIEEALKEFGYELTWRKNNA